MVERVAINTGPLVALARMDALSVAGQLSLVFVCPPEVREELEEGARLGHIPVAPLWLRVMDLEHPVSSVAVAALDAGEAAVIQLALEQGISWVCMDEWKGRRAASSAGLRVVGALGLLGRAKAEGIIPAVGPYVNRALAMGVRYDAILVRRILEAAGE